MFKCTSLLFLFMTLPILPIFPAVHFQYAAFYGDQDLRHPPFNLAFQFRGWKGKWNRITFTFSTLAHHFCRIFPSETVPNYYYYYCECANLTSSRGCHTKVCTISVTYAPGLIILITGITFVVAGMRRTFSHVPLSLALYVGFRESLRVWLVYADMWTSEFYLRALFNCLQ